MARERVAVERDVFGDDEVFDDDEDLGDDKDFCLEIEAPANGQKENQAEPAEADGLDRRAQAPPPLSCADSDGARAGMNPKRLGKKDNHDQEPWKIPLRHYIEHLYFKHYGKERPDVVLSIEEKIRRDEEKRARRREAKLLRRQAEAAEQAKPEPNCVFSGYACSHEKADEIDDSSGNFGMLLDDLFRGWIKACQAAGADADETAKSLLGWMEDDPYGFCHDLDREAVKVLDKDGLEALTRQVRAKFETATGSANGDGESLAGKQLLSQEWFAMARTPGKVNDGYGFMNFFLNTGRKSLPSAPLTAYSHRGHGADIIYVDEENDLVVVARWIDGGIQRVYRKGFGLYQGPSTFGVSGPTTHRRSRLGLAASSHVFFSCPASPRCFEQRWEGQRDPANAGLVFSEPP